MPSHTSNTAAASGGTSTIATALESGSNQIALELASEAAAVTPLVRVEYSAVRRDRTCPEGYVALGRRQCIAVFEDSQQQCAKGEQVLVVETEAEMARVESIINMRQVGGKTVFSNGRLPLPGIGRGRARRSASSCLAGNHILSHKTEGGPSTRHLLGQ